MKYKDNSKIGSIMQPTANELAIEMNDKKWPKIKGFTNRELVSLRYGNFHQQLLPFYEVFGRNRIIFLDGTNMEMIYHRLISFWTNDHSEDHFTDKSEVFLNQFCEVSFLKSFKLPFAVK